MYVLDTYTCVCVYMYICIHIVYIHRLKHKRDSALEEFNDGASGVSGAQSSMVLHNDNTNIYNNNSNNNDKT